MRVRIVSSPPLPVLKAWFPLGVDSAHPVGDLKSRLCETLQALRDAHVRARDILLLLDDFELLDETSVDVLRDGDLINIRLRIDSAKRKTDPDDEPPHKKVKLSDSTYPVQKALQTPQSSSKHLEAVAASPKPKPVAADSLSDDSSSSSDDTSSDEESSSDSDFGSESESSDSSSDTTPPAQSSKLHGKSKPSSSVVSNPPPSVPPGHGKPQTQSRNLRRRKKRQYEREATLSAPIPSISSASSNAIPLGTSKPSAERDMEDDPAIAMMSLSNKNKRRGFKRAMNGQLPTRITFDDTTPSNSASVAPPTPDLSSPRKPPRLIPPSEKQDLGFLPPNLFVTSVDVEAGLWPQSTRKVKGKQRAYQVYAEEDVKQWEWKEQKRQPNGYGQDVHVEEVEATILPYDDESAEALVHGQASTPEIDWNTVEKQWATLQAISLPFTLTAGNIVGWKELGIHPISLTPEMLLILARVENVVEDKVSVKLLVRPGAGPPSFSVELDEELVEEETEYRVSDLVSLGSKVIKQ